MKLENDNTAKQIANQVYEFVKRDKGLNKILQKTITDQYKVDYDSSVVKINEIETRPLESMHQIAVRLLKEIAELESSPDEKNKRVLYREICGVLNKLLKINHELTADLQEEVAEKGKLENTISKICKEKEKLLQAIEKLETNRKEEAVVMVQSNESKDAEIKQLREKIIDLTNQIEEKESQNNAHLQQFNETMKKNKDQMDKMEVLLKKSEHREKKGAEREKNLQREFVALLEKSEKHSAQMDKQVCERDLQLQRSKSEMENLVSPRSARSTPQLTGGYCSTTPHQQKSSLIITGRSSVIPVAPPRKSILKMQEQVISPQNVHSDLKGVEISEQKKSVKSAGHVSSDRSGAKTPGKPQELLMLRDSTAEDVKNGNYHTLHALSFDADRLMADKSFRDNPVKVMKKALYPTPVENIAFAYISSDQNGKSETKSDGYSKNLRGSYSFNVDCTALAVEMKEVLLKHNYRNFIFCLLRKQKSSKVKVTRTDQKSAIRLANQLIEKLETISEDIVVEPVEEKVLIPTIVHEKKTKD